MKISIHIFKQFIIYQYTFKKAIYLCISYLILHWKSFIVYYKCKKYHLLIKAIGNLFLWINFIFLHYKILKKNLWQIIHVIATFLRNLYLHPLLHFYLWKVSDTIIFCLSRRIKTLFIKLVKYRQTIFIIGFFFIVGAFPYLLKLTNC